MTAHPLPDWRQSELVVVVPNVEMEIDVDFDSELVELFAKRLNVKLQLLHQTADAATLSLNEGRAHLATGFRTGSQPSLRFSKHYQTLDERLVCNTDSPRRFDDVHGHVIAVANGSAQEAALRIVRNEHEDIEWESRKGNSPFGLLQEVAEDKLECTVANEEQIASMRNYYPNLSSRLSLNSPSQMSWAISTEGDHALLEEIDKFMDAIKQDNTLSHLIDRHYGHNERLGVVDTETFIAHTQSKLPHYRQWFEDAADLTGFDWRLLAALAYRESRWDPNATSFTNVRGFMMLTEATADQMGVQNRLDAQESIMAGARYLQLLKEHLPLRIPDNARTWMALAAYNQGMGHLEDARILALRSGLNPDVWSDVKHVMPLLSREEYYSTTKHGKARGGEAVVHVETVRLYHDMLKRLDTQHALGNTPQELQHGFMGLFKSKLGLQPPKL
jgi:membrane-bound lytic murein transglycosylase F